MKDIIIGDKVFDENGILCNVVACTDVMENRPCFLVKFSDGTKIICDENHEWLTFSAKARQSLRNSRKNNREFIFDGQSSKRTIASIKTTSEISNSLIVNNGCWAGLLEHSVQVSKPLQLPEIYLPIDPYVLGAWLGDGNSSEAGFTSSDQFIIDEIVARGVNVTKRSSKYGYGLTGGLIKYLREINLINN